MIKDMKYNAAKILSYNSPYWQATYLGLRIQITLPDKRQMLLEYNSGKAIKYTFREPIGYRDAIGS